MTSRSTHLRTSVAKTILISTSGALSPGPLSMSAVALGAILGPLAGLMIALGHMLFEAPYVFVLMRFSKKINSIIKRREKPLITITTAFIFFFSYLLIKDGLAYIMATREAPGGSDVTFITSSYSLLGALLVGIILSGTNAYFLLWWVTVGLPIIQDMAYYSSVSKFLLVYLSHIWMDYAWLIMLSTGGGIARLFGIKVYAFLLIAISIILMVFGVDLLIRAYLRRKILPF
ncbi:MAG: lysine transporter LysE [Thermoprotei archaeon]|nr:MAG: lysine transporter LysE [Thermoprotei archaeon]